jgi:hypothetical protein
MMRHINVRLIVDGIPANLNHDARVLTQSFDAHQRKVVTAFTFMNPEMNVKALQFLHFNLPILQILIANPALLTDNACCTVPTS